MNTFSKITGRLPRGLTYRQIDHWVTHYPGTFSITSRGTGNSRHFTNGDVEALTVMYHLVTAGFTVAASAAFAARRTRTGRLSPFVSVTVHHPEDS